MLLYYHGGKVHLCTNLWRAGVSYLPSLRTKDANSIILVTRTGTYLENFDIKFFSTC